MPEWAMLSNSSRSLLSHTHPHARTHTHRQTAWPLLPTSHACLRVWASACAWRVCLCPSKCVYMCFPVTACLVCENGREAWLTLRERNKRGIRWRSNKAGMLNFGRQMSSGQREGWKNCHYIHKLIFSCPVLSHLLLILNQVLVIVHFDLQIFYYV